MSLDIVINGKLDAPQVIALYQANGWSSGEKPRELLSALSNSHTVVTAWDNDRLVGLCNALSDGFLVVYYPHLLVHPDYHHRGIGTRLMQTMQTIYRHLHQQILVADGGAIKFYQSLGFSRAGKAEPMWIYAGHDHD